MDHPSLASRRSASILLSLSVERVLLLPGPHWAAFNASALVITSWRRRRGVVFEIEIFRLAAIRISDFKAATLRDRFLRDEENSRLLIALHPFEGAMLAVLHLDPVRRTAATVGPIRALLVQHPHEKAPNSGRRAGGFFRTAAATRGRTRQLHDERTARQWFRPTPHESLTIDGGDAVGVADCPKRTRCGSHSDSFAVLCMDCQDRNSCNLRLDRIERTCRDW